MQSFEQCVKKGERAIEYSKDIELTKQDIEHHQKLGFSKIKRSNGNLLFVKRKLND